MDGECNMTKCKHNMIYKTPIESIEIASEFISFSVCSVDGLGLNLICDDCGEIVTVKLGDNHIEYICGECGGHMVYITMITDPPKNYYRCSNCDRHVETTKVK